LTRCGRLVIGIGHLFVGKIASSCDKRPCSLGGGHCLVARGARTAGRGSFPHAARPLIVGGAPRVLDRRTLLSSPRPLRARRAPSPARKGPLLLNRGPLSAIRGPLVGHGLQLQSVRGPLLTGDGPLHAREGSPERVRDPRPADNGPSPRGRGPCFLSEGSSRKAKGHLPEARGRFLVGRGPLSVSKGPRPGNEVPFPMEQRPLGHFKVRRLAFETPFARVNAAPPRVREPLRRAGAALSARSGAWQRTSLLPSS